MKKSFLLTGALCLGMSLGSCSLFKKGNTVSVISTTSVQDSLPYQLLEGKPWKADPSTEYVKIDFVMDQEIKLDEVAIDLDNEMSSPIMIYLNVKDDVQTVYPKGKKISVKYGSVKKVTSVNFNFGKNKNVAIKQLRFLQDGSALRLRPARVVKGEVKASSTLDPLRSYDVRGIFDSRVEYGWSSRGKATGEALEFRFAEPQTIASLKIWNGYQRSRLHYDANSRAKTILLEDGKGYSEKLSLNDDMGPQELKLSKKIKVSSLKMTVTENYAGKDYADLVISELRFFDGDNYFLIDTAKYLQENVAYNRDIFRKAGLDAILDSQLVYRNTNEDFAGESLIFRFRSDGSVYAEGVIKEDEKKHNYFLLGNYEVVKATADNFSVKLFGFIVISEGEWKAAQIAETRFYTVAAANDAESQVFEGGGDCGGGGDNGEYVYKDAVKKIFTEYLTLKKVESGYEFTNTGAKKNLSFETALLVKE